MYDEHYRYSSMPFQLTPDSRFFFGSLGHSRAIAHLTYGLAQGEGFIIVTGEVGAGKTTLVERLWSQLDRSTYTVVRIGTTQVTNDDLFRLAMAGFGVEPEPGLDKATLLLRFEQVLREHAAAGRRCLLVVDEVQNLPMPALEELRMLSNLTEDGRAAMQTILLGQPEFRARLAGPGLDQLRQRVISSYHLGPLGPAETSAYIRHRLAAVGWNGDNPAWDEAALEAVHRHTGGIPRRINRLCSRVLLYGALEEATRITRTMVDSTAEELREDLEGGAPARGAAGHGANGHAAYLPNGTAELAHAGGAIQERTARELHGLHGRVEALEAQVARRERVFQRLLDVFGHQAAAAAGGYTRDYSA